MRLQTPPRETTDAVVKEPLAAPVIVRPLTNLGLTALMQSDQPRGPSGNEAARR